ncbi:MAG: hypothetical protein L6Q99_20555 [Planctomycetes bacterium]|nr:hypothetical protein [Planctomycetota bacterium]
MNRQSLLLAAFACLASLASAQGIDLSKVHPVTKTPKHAGVFNIRTGRFHTAGGAGPLSLVLQNVYNNTCVAGFYTAVAECEDFYDEGRVPSQVGPTTYPNHSLETIELAYCTSATTGLVDLDWELYDTQAGLAGGSCGFGSAGTPQPFTAGVAFFDSSAAGFPLPGATSASGPGCWIIGFSTGTITTCLTSGANSADQFVFRFSQNNTPAQMGGGTAGPILAGAPGTGVPGCGTFNLPACAGGCGSGLDNLDAFWINQDAGTVGGVCTTGGTGAPSTGCYWFGGYPTNPFGGIFLRMEGDGSCTTTGNVIAYCTAKVNSLGCTPAVMAVGIPRVSTCATTGFKLHASNLLGNKNGLWFYGTNGLSGIAFQGGHLCIKPAIKRLNVQNSGGQGSACNGAITTDFNARICSGSDSALVAGALVGTQCWSRDPASPSTTNLTSAISFVIAP